MLVQSDEIITKFYTEKRAQHQYDFTCLIF